MALLLPPSQTMKDKRSTLVSFNANDYMDGIAHVRAEGFEVDDNNKALPKNVLVAAPSDKVSKDGLHQGHAWGWDDIDKQAVAGEVGGE